jgi:hypothetical protein
VKAVTVQPLDAGSVRYEEVPEPDDIKVVLDFGA